LGLTFFGLTPEYRLTVFTQIHDIVFYGKGGYSWEAIYNMPIWLRRFTYNKLYEHYQEKENSNNTPSQNITSQELKQALRKRQTTEASYVTKVSKK
jgi:hypothetical protein